MIPKKQTHATTPTESATIDLFGTSTKVDRKRVGRAPGEKRERPTAAQSATNRRLDKLDQAWQNTAPPITPQEDTWRHSHWRNTRAKIRDAIQSTGANERQLWAWDNCGAGALVQWSDSEQRYRVSSCHCKSRHCQPCAAARATLIRLNLFTRLQARPDGRYRFLTLTLKHTTAPLREQIDRLFASFKKLRNSQLWKPIVGGCFVLETKLSAQGHWHPHLHVVAEGGWIHQAQLSDQWLAITGDSYIVDIRQLANPKDAAAYIAKYITKSVDHTVWSDRDKAQEFVTATKGLRVANTFGGWRKFRLLAKPNGTGDWVPICHLTTLFRRAADGERAAQAIIEVLQIQRDVPNTG